MVDNTNLTQGVFLYNFRIGGQESCTITNPFPSIVYINRFNSLLMSHYLEIRWYWPQENILPLNLCVCVCSLVIHFCVCVSSFGILLSLVRNLSTTVFGSLRTLIVLDFLCSFLGRGLRSLLYSRSVVELKPEHRGLETHLYKNK